MSKTDKELAVEIGIAYVQAAGQRKLPSGSSKDLLTIETINEIIKTAYTSLKEMN